MDIAGVRPQCEILYNETIEQNIGAGVVMLSTFSVFFRSHGPAYGSITYGKGLYLGQYTRSMYVLPFSWFP